ncbi:MAG: nucleotidyltransferase domain-containing protein, partial [Blastocatellia bacterium]
MKENARLSYLSSPSSPASPAGQWLLSLLRGETVPFPGDVPGGEMKRFLQFTADAGIQPYLCYRLKQIGGWQTCPPVLAEALEGRYLMERIAARLRRDELTYILAEFDRHGIRALVLKGSALVHLIYPEPNLRPACDIDLLVDPAARPRAEQAILSLGYRLTNTYNFEAQYFRRKNNVEHLLDLHWKLSDSPFLSPLFAFEELFDRSIPINGLSIS